MLIALLLSLNPTSPVPPHYVTGDSVLMRSTGSAQGEIVNALAWGTQVTPLSAPTEDAYVQVRVEGTAVTGFVAASLVSSTPPTSQAPAQWLGHEFCGQPHEFGMRIDASTECEGFPLQKLAPRRGELERALAQSDLTRRKLTWSLVLSEGSTYAKYASAEVLNSSPLLSPVPLTPHLNARQGDPSHAKVFDSKELGRDKTAPDSMWILNVSPSGERLLLGEGALPGGPVSLSADKSTVLFESELTAFVFNPCDASFQEQRLTDIRYTLATGTTSAAPSDPALVEQLRACQRSRKTGPQNPRLLAQSFFLAVDLSESQDMKKALEGSLGERRSGVVEYGALAPGSFEFHFEESQYLQDGKHSAFVRELFFSECADEHQLYLQFLAEGEWQTLSLASDTGCEP